MLLSTEPAQLQFYLHATEEECSSAERSASQLLQQWTHPSLPSRKASPCQVPLSHHGTLVHAKVAIVILELRFSCLACGRLRTQPIQSSLKRMDILGGLVLAGCRAVQHGSSKAPPKALWHLHLLLALRWLPGHAGEFEPHEGCWMGWPESEDSQYLWREGGEPARGAYANVAKAISQFEPLYMIANPGEPAANARKVFEDSPNVNVVEVPINDGWTRDWGPSVSLYYFTPHAVPQLSLKK